MFSKENRLSKTRDFSLLMKYGRWGRGVFLDIKVLELAKVKAYWPKKVEVESFGKQLKLAISVGLKVSKSAVKRNRAKRQIREFIRPLLKVGQLKAGFYVLLVAKPSILDKNFAEISQETKVLLEKVGILVS